MTLSRFLKAFPTHLQADVAATLAVIPDARIAPTPHDVGSIFVEHEALSIPYRLYNPLPPELASASLSSTQSLILGCIYTRHHDGHVREQALHDILHHLGPWSVPFAVQLLGEYVLPLVTAVEAAMTNEVRTIFASFGAANASFLALTESRATSYWDCYYRSQYHTRGEYPGVRAVHRLRSWVNTIPLPAAT